MTTDNLSLKNEQSCLFVILRHKQIENNRTEKCNTFFQLTCKEKSWEQEACLIKYGLRHHADYTKK